MRRGQKPAKSKDAKLGVARKARKSDGARVRDLEKRLAEALKDKAEALEQQTATSEILRVISSSPTDLQPVFETVVENAVRLCEAERAFLFRYDGDVLRVAATHNVSPTRRDFAERHPIHPGRHSAGARAALERRTIHIHDIQADPEYTYQVGQSDPAPTRTVLSVPMLRTDELLGVITIFRHEVRPFTDSQITLLQTFADQAVIAIENVRLFTELQEKNRALTQAHAQVTESLEQQTATSEILRVIAGSPTDLQPVFDTIAENAARLCGAADAAIRRIEGNELRLVARFGPIPFVAPDVVPVSRNYPTGLSVIERRTIHIADILALMETEFPSISRELRTVLATPLLREGVPIGAIVIRRAEIQPFTDAQIGLLKTFADQAVIAIENVRLFRELQTRNADLTDALSRETATSEILRVISGSPTDVQPVFDTIIKSAVTLCNGVFGSLDRFDGDLIYPVATHNYTPEALDAVQRMFPTRPSRSLGVGRAILDRDVIHIPDVELDPEYRVQNLAGTIGFRSGLFVPMLRDRVPIGVILVGRAEPGPFSDNQIALLKTFADQAVIAVENVRLFKELEAANRELAAGSQHKSEFLANMSHELRTPLNAIIGFSEVLSDRMFGELNEKQEEYLKDIYASGTHLLSLINDILDLSKIEAGRMELELTDFDLPTALDNALTLVRERAGRRSIALHTSIDNRLGEIQGDERKIRQVVLNLLSNAIKFTPEGWRIEVAAVPKDGLVEVSVSDTGVGIAPEDQEKVFEEFRQVGTADKKAEGTGLGLTLCRKFIELHGGRIWVKSQIGVGSTFTFTIPLRMGE